MQLINNSFADSQNWLYGAAAKTLINTIKGNRLKIPIEVEIYTSDSNNRIVNVDGHYFYDENGYEYSYGSVFSSNSEKFFQIVDLLYTQRIE